MYLQFLMKVSLRANLLGVKCAMLAKHVLEIFTKSYEILEIMLEQIDTMKLRE